MASVQEKYSCVNRRHSGKFDKNLLFSTVATPFFYRKMITFLGFCLNIYGIITISVMFGICDYYSNRMPAIFNGIVTWKTA